MDSARLVCNDVAKQCDHRPDRRVKSDHFAGDFIGKLETAFGCEILLGYGASRIVRFTPDGEGTSAAFGLINTRCRTRQRNARAAGRPRRSVELSAGPITMEA